MAALREERAYLIEELSKTRQERAAAVTFIRDRQLWASFKQHIWLTSCHDYEKLERALIAQSRHIYARQQRILRDN